MELYEVIIRIMICVAVGIVAFFPIVIAKKCYREQFDIQASEYFYVMRSPQKLFWYGTLCTFGFYIFTVLTIFIYKRISDLYSVVFFGGFTLSATYVSIYCLLWKAVVDRNLLIIHIPGFPLKKIYLYDISEIKWKKHRIVGYVNGRKFFDIDDDASNFNMFYRDLYCVGKIKHKQLRENFWVTSNKQYIITSGIGTVFFGGLLVLLIFFVKDELGAIYYIINVFITALSLSEFIETILWKVTISFNKIGVRDKFHRFKTYSLQEVTMVYETKDSIAIYIGEKEIVKVFEWYDNYQLLLDRLHYEGIVFYRKEN